MGPKWLQICSKMAPNLAGMAPNGQYLGNILQYSGNILVIFLNILALADPWILIFLTAPNPLLEVTIEGIPIVAANIGDLRYWQPISEPPIMAMNGFATCQYRRPPILAANIGTPPILAARDANIGTLPILATRGCQYRRPSDIGI